MANGNPEEIPFKSDSNHRKGATLSEPASVSIRAYIFFPPDKHIVSFTTFRLYVEIHFYTADGPGPFHWPLAPGGLLAGIQGSHCHRPISISGQELKPCFKPLQAEATQDHLHSEVGQL